MNMRCLPCQARLLACCHILCLSIIICLSSVYLSTPPVPSHFSLDCLWVTPLPQTHILFWVLKNNPHAFVKICQSKNHSSVIALAYNNNENRRHCLICPCSSKCHHLNYAQMISGHNTNSVLFTVESHGKWEKQHKHVHLKYGKHLRQQLPK